MLCNFCSFSSSLNGHPSSGIVGVRRGCQRCRSGSPASVRWRWCFESMLAVAPWERAC